MTSRQRMEEIQRRGMALRQKRKMRQLSCSLVCSAVGLGLGIWLAVSSLPQPSAPQLQDTLISTPQQEGTDPIIDPIVTEESAPLRQLEVLSHGEQYLCTDSAQLTEVYGLLAALCPLSSITNMDDYDYSSNASATDQYVAESEPPMELRLTMADGSLQVYTLEDDLLTNETAAERYLLTPEQLNRLQDLLRTERM